MYTMCRSMFREYTCMFSDINECEMDNDCDEENGVCTNTNGSYLCSCKMGFRFSGIGFSCSGQSIRVDVYFNIHMFIIVLIGQQAFVRVT